MIQTEIQNPSAELSVNERKDEEIRAKSCPRCIVCGSEGQVLYVGAQDRLFGASGSWDVKRCFNSQCGLIWLDPMPLREDVGKAYRKYYTHSKTKLVTPPGLAKRIFWEMRRGFWANRYGYSNEELSLGIRCLGLVLPIFPVRCREVEHDIRFLPFVPGGRLLDVGCGSGEWLSAMQKRGWQVEGIDFDDQAVAVAKARGLSVRCGSLDTEKFPGASFDAVTLNHVIEHVPDPVQTVRQCERLLKPGGRLVLATPNAGSLGHKVFKANWRGLEPPRHLHLFSMQSLRRLVSIAGFQEISLVPFIANSVIYESLLLERGWKDFTQGVPRDATVKVVTELFKLLELFLIALNSSVADCMVAVAVKNAE